MASLFQPPSQMVERFTPSDIVHQQRPGSATVVRTGDGAERLLAGLFGYHVAVQLVDGRRPRAAAAALAQSRLTVSQICNLIWRLSMVIMRAPNSTPIVRSCTGWKRLSVNCRSRHDLPTPARVACTAAVRLEGSARQKTTTRAGRAVRCWGGQATTYRCRQ